MISKPLSKLSAVILILQLAIPVQAYAIGNPFKAAKPTDGAEVDIHACGKFKIDADLPDTETPNVCQMNEGTGKTDGYKTKGASVVVHISKSVLEGAKSCKEILDQVLLDSILEQVQKKLKAFTWVDAVKSVKSEDPEVAKTVAAVKEKYQEFSDEVLKDDGLGPKHQIQKLLTLYPDIEASILQTNPEFRSLICRYELNRHRKEILKGFAKGLSIVATIAILAGGAATAYFWIPALAPLLLAAGGVETASGLLKIGSAITKWDDVRAAKTAKALLDFYKDNDKLIDELQKDPVTNADKIAYLKQHRPDQRELDRLKDIKKLKRKEIGELLSGILDTAFGAAAIYGGILVGKHFANFAEPAGSKANVTNPYTPNTTGGGSTGAGTDDGG